MHTGPEPRRSPQPAQTPSPAHDTEAPAGEESLHRALTNRHVQLIAIGGTIGTGLFMGAGKSIAVAGPSIIVAYSLVGLMLFLVMRALGELLLSDLAYGSFAQCCGDLLGPWAGFFVGWTYWLCWIVTATAELIAIAGYLQFWWPTLPPWLVAAGCSGMLLAVNLTHVKVFGELEFWVALVKIVAIGALIVVGIVFISEARITNGHAASVTHLWRAGGVFPNGTSGFFAGFQIAVFAFVGIELVGTVAAETAAPQRTLPRAINAIPVRIMLFYIGALVVIMCVTPWYAVASDRSPFVALFEVAKLPGAASTVNFVVVSAAASAANSGIFSTSRMLYGLSLRGHAPAAFVTLSRRRVPVYALMFSCVCLLVSTGLLYWMPDLMFAFTLITTVATLLFIFVWSMIVLAYLRYRHVHAARHADSAFKMPGGRLSCAVVLLFFVMLLVALTQRADTLAALQIVPAWFVILGLAWWWRAHAFRTR